MDKMFVIVASMAEGDESGFSQWEQVIAVLPTELAARRFAEDLESGDEILVDYLPLHGWPERIEVRGVPFLVGPWRGPR